MEIEQQKYNWKRYWYPRESSIELLDGDYPYKPDIAWSDLVNPALVTLESLADVPCLILLGEPGIGKTSEMENFETFTRNTVSTAILWFDLKGYQTELLLQEELFKSPPFQSWLTGTHLLYLFLDGLDEGLLTISILASLLARNLQKCPISRLHLRIACRTADWPNDLEETLGRLWGKEKVAVYQLAPLRREDVAEAAAVQKLDVKHFLSEVDLKGIASLASKPFTLRFLLSIYQRSKTFPSSQEKLYYEGLLHLCEEQSPFRRSAGFRGNLSSEQRLIVASRIAALTVFTNHAIVRTDSELDEGSPESGIMLRELGSGIEHIHGYEVIIDEKALEETLNTGLFISRGSERFGWAHRTYAEFLAAWYLVQHKVTLPQIMSLLVHPGGAEQRLVPQLHETAAWIATTRSDVFDQIMSIDPEVLLRSDVTTAEERDRAALVETLLLLQDDARQAHLYHNLRSFYWKLDHSGLYSQLSPYILDNTASQAVRMLAIDIAEACKLQVLQSAMADIALNPSEPLLVRTEAAHAIIRISDEETKAKLKPLASGICEDDSDDELKGYALQAVWPRHLTVKELFAALAPPKRQNYFGSYRRFLTSHFITHLQPADLSIALQWVVERVSRSDGRYQYSIFFPITHDILLLTWAHLDMSGVLEAFARAIVTSVEHYAVLPEQESQELIQLLADENKRRRVLAAALRECVQCGSDPICLFDYKPRLMLQGDILWLIEYLSQTEIEVLQKAIARLIGCMINVNTLENKELMDAVYIASQYSPFLASELSWLLQPVQLGSPEAARMKEAYQREKRWKEEQRLFTLRADVPSMERIAQLLDECEQGDIMTWKQVYYDMAYRSDGTPYGDEFRQAHFPNWDKADSAIRTRMIEVAKGYVQVSESEPEDWLGTNSYPFSTVVMYKTLQMLAQETQAYLSTLPVEQWTKFIPVILTWCDPVHKPIDHELVALVYRIAPDTVIQTMLLLIAKQDKLFQEPPVIQEVESCWDARLAHALLEKVRDENVGPGGVECLLRTLLQHQVSEAREFALSLVDGSLTEEHSKMRALIAAKMLLRYADDPGWSVIWSAMQLDEDFGTKLVVKFAQSFSGWVPSQLTEDQLADLYVWLVRHYLPSQYPIPTEASFAGTADSVALWRDALIGGLRDRGTFEACKAIQRIASELPELDQFMLKWILLEAQELARRSTWKPFSPEEILRVVNDSQLRLVQNGEQLLEVVIESLKRLEAKFHDETPAWRDVWDRIPVASSKQTAEGISRKRREYEYWPIDENDFSNYVKRHLEENLRQRGVIANREVVIRKDERTDIHVDAVIRNSQREIYDTVSVIVEVKGCWNRELLTAMKEQLVERYLKENHCHYGLYLIGWFNCGEWDSGDYRKGDAPNMPIGEAQRQFDAQAAELSLQGINVRALVLNASVR